MKRAGVYVRVSTQEQAQEGYSIGAQKERLLSYCKANDWLVVDVYVDGGFSGSSLDRPAITKLIDDIEKMDVVLVYKLDRLRRLFVLPYKKPRLGLRIRSGVLL